MATVLLEMTPHRAVEQLLSELGLSQNDLARALDTDPRTIGRWRAGRSYPQQAARRRLSALLDLQHRLAETFSSAEAARAWLHAESRYLGGLSPADALRAGRIDRVEAALEALDSGVFI
jgi:transcriptional regulator with XRE-family HTH domain